MNVRPITESDFDGLTTLYLKVYPEEKDRAQAQAYLAKFFAFEPDRCLVVEQDGGGLSAAVLAYTYYKAGRLVLFLQDLFVDPDARHRGYGRDLVAGVRESCSDRPRVKVVPLVKADTSVLNFYNSLGFERDQVFSFFDDDLYK